MVIGRNQNLLQSSQAQYICAVVEFVEEYKNSAGIQYAWDRSQGQVVEMRGQARAKYPELKENCRRQDMKLLRST